MKRKICFVVSDPGTARAFLKTPMQKLSPEYDIYLVANTNGSDMTTELPIKECKDIKIERRPDIFVDLKALRQLYRYFKKNGFYAVHSYTLKASLLTAIAGKWARVPKRIRNFSGQLWCNMTGLKRRFYKAIEHIIVRRDNYFMVDCNSQRQYLIDEGILKSPDQAYIPANGSVCGINIKKFEFSQTKRDSMRKKLGFSEDMVVFVYLGRIRKEKGVNEILAAFDRLASCYDKAFLLMVGREEDDTLSTLNKYSNIHDGVNYHYYGFTSEPELLLHSADVFLFPSYREGFGLAVLEASCVRLPVICSDAYGVMDAMVDDVTGLRCKARDVDSLYNCMERLYLDKDLRARLGQAGMERVIKDFPSELVTDAWVDFYKMVSSN